MQIIKPNPNTETINVRILVYISFVRKTDASINWMFVLYFGGFEELLIRNLVLGPEPSIISLKRFSMRAEINTLRMDVLSAIIGPHEPHDFRFNLFNPK